MIGQWKKRGVNKLSEDNTNALTSAEIIDLFKNKNVFQMDGGLKLQSKNVINFRIEKKMTQNNDVYLAINLSSGHPTQFLSTFEFISTMEPRVLVEAIRIMEMAGEHCFDAVKTSIRMTKKLKEETED